jgi:hypothetical protein
MISLIFTALLILVFVDPMIRKADDSKVKRIWLKIIKKPLFGTLSDFNKKITDGLIKKYGDGKTKMIDEEKMMNDLSNKYVYHMIVLAFVLILISIISLFL